MSWIIVAADVDIGARFIAAEQAAAGRRSLMPIEHMIATHPDVRGQVNRTLIEAIDAAYPCAQTCTACADACLAEDVVKQLRQCIRLSLDCAGVCDAFAMLASRRTGSNAEVVGKMLYACISACRLCGEECQRHASKHEHCRMCAEVCRRCETACQTAWRSMESVAGAEARSASRPDGEAGRRVARGQARFLSAIAPRLQPTASSERRRRSTSNCDGP